MSGKLRAHSYPALHPEVGEALTESSLRYEKSVPLLCISAGKLGRIEPSAFMPN